MEEQADTVERVDIDWAYIEEELNDVPSEYKEPRFYPLKHVVDIFSSGDPQQHTAELRDLEARLGELVDVVVEGYHTGFTRSIQNYSHILSLFQDSKQQMDSMRHALTNATRQLAAHSNHLSQQWVRTTSLTASVSLLEEVQAVAGLPARIQHAVNGKDWPVAVSLLLEVCTRLSHEDMLRVGALRKLRNDIGSTTRSIRMKMCEALLALAYNKHAGQAAEVPAPAANAHVLLGSPGSKTAGRQQHWRVWSTVGKRPDAATLAGREYSDLQGVSPDQATAPPPADARQLVACLASLDAIDEAKAFLAYSARAQVRTLICSAVEQAAAAAAQSYHAVAGSGQEGMSLAVPHHLEVLAQKLVQGMADVCLKVLVAVVDVLEELADAPTPQPSVALDMIRLHLLGKQDEAAGAQARPAAAGGGGGGGEGGAGGRGRGAHQASRQAYIRAEILHVWMQMQEEWHLVLSHLLRSPLRALGSHGALASKKAAPAVGPVGNLLMQPLNWLQKIDELSEHISTQVEAVLGGDASPPPAPPPAAGGGSGPGSGVASPSTSTPGYAGGPGTPGGGTPGGRTQAVQHVPRIPFTLDLQVKVMARSASWAGPGGPAGRQQGPADKQSTQGYPVLVVKALGGSEGNMYLTPAIYLPLTSFTDVALNIMKSHLGLGKSAGKGRRGAGSAAADTQQACTSLKTCLEDFALETLLPQIWMDLRARCTTALEHPDAFKPQLHTLYLIEREAASAAAVTASTALSGPQDGAAGAGGGGRAGGSGKGVVPAARFAERMLQDVATWSMAMPAFEDSFMGVAENILGRMLDSFWSSLAGLAAEHAPFHTALKYEVTFSQALESDAALLAAPANFSVPRPGVGELDVDGFIAAINTQGRPELVQLVGGRAGLAAVAEHASIGLHGAGHRASAPGTASGHAGAGPGRMVSKLEAELELQMLAYKDRPTQASMLMSGGGMKVTKLVAIAALGESLEFICDAVIRAAVKRTKAPQSRQGQAKHGPRQGQLSRFGRPKGNASLARDSVGSRGAQQELIDQLPRSLVQLVYRIKALAGLCIRILRLELQALVAFTFHALSREVHLVEPGDDAREVHPDLSLLSRNLSRVADELGGQLSTSRLAYVLAGVPTAAARMAMWALPDIRQINGMGTDRMVRSLSMLQPVLMGLVPPLSSTAQVEPGLEADMRAARMNVFDKARAYYQLLRSPADEVVRQASQHTMRFTYSEWMALLQVSVPGRAVSDAQLAALQGVLDRAHGLTTGQKIVGAVGSVLNTVLAAPAEKVADVALDVLKLGAEGLVAGAMIPARQIGKVFRKLEAVARDVTDKAKGNTNN